MSTVNKVILIGHLGDDVQIKKFDNGGTIANFSLATNEKYKNRDGDLVNDTEWHSISVRIPRLIELCEKYLKKGDKLYLEGKLKTRNWEDAEKQKHYKTEVILESMTFLGTSNPKSKSGESGSKDLPF